MSVSELIRQLTGLGGDRDFLDVSTRSGTTTKRSSGGFPTVITIHGFTGVPGEVEVCRQLAEDQGLATVAPLLAGHGSNARRMAETNYSDWLTSAAIEFDRARANGPVILLGLSLGSLIATELCLQAPGDVAGLVLLSNAFWLKAPHPSLSLRAAASTGLRSLYMDKDGADIGDEAGRAHHVTLDAQPIRSAISLEKAGRRLREELFRVHRPTLIVHGARDQVCPVANGWKVASRLGTNDCRLVILPRSHHILTRDADAPRLQIELSEFFTRVSRGAHAW